MQDKIRSDMQEPLSPILNFTGWLLCLQFPTKRSLLLVKLLTLSESPLNANMLCGKWKQSPHYQPFIQIDNFPQRTRKSLDHETKVMYKKQREGQEWIHSPLKVRIDNADWEASKYQKRKKGNSERKTNMYEYLLYTRHFQECHCFILTINL